ncbi:HAMP domain-containing sensor histidine kinase [Marinobacter mangrovi]|uniref:HAMP domain-containing sensor histidine kinase n=1 Tax=Marinobacter mangrovi TaxID=2803918 RepID=UPI001932FC34|nr:ATP-binding protein [Marinobacter mangrovi]
MKPSRLFWKLVLAFWLALTLSFFVGAVVMHLSNPDHPTPEMMDTLMVVHQSQRIIETEGYEAALPLLRTRQHADDITLGLLDDSGHLIAGTRPDTIQSTFTAVDNLGRHYRLVADHPLKMQHPPRPTALVPMGIGAIISILFSLFLAWYLSGPLNHISQGLRSVGAGELSTRIQPLMGRRRDEIVALGNDFDRMASQLQHLMDERKQFLHDISHELRSPLTRLRVAIGLLSRSPEMQPEMLQRIDRESERLDRLIEELLTLSHLEAGIDDIASERVDLIELLNVIAEDAGFEASTKDATVSLEYDGPFVTTVSGELLCRAFENVIRNAVRFTAPGTAVRIVTWIDPADDQLHAQICDSGPGVSDEWLERIFEPFQRGPEVGTGSGAGLGLAIARRAIVMHGGHISAGHAPGGGLCVTITLPRVREDRQAKPTTQWTDQPTTESG